MNRHINKRKILEKIIRGTEFAKNLYSGSKQKILNTAIEGKKRRLQTGGVFKGRRRQRGVFLKADGDNVVDFYI